MSYPQQDWIDPSRHLEREWNPFSPLSLTPTLYFIHRLSGCSFTYSRAFTSSIQSAVLLTESLSSSSINSLSSFLPRCFFNLFLVYSSSSPIVYPLPNTSFFLISSLPSPPHYPFFFFFFLPFHLFPPFPFPPHPFSPFSLTSVFEFLSPPPPSPFCLLPLPFTSTPGFVSALIDHYVVRRTLAHTLQLFSS